MKFSVVMPQLGLTMTEGTVSQWLRKPGDKVQKGEFLFVVSTDKAEMKLVLLKRRQRLLHVARTRSRFAWRIAFQLCTARRRLENPLGARGLQLLPGRVD